MNIYVCTCAQAYSHAHPLTYVPTVPLSFSEKDISHIDHTVHIWDKNIACMHPHSLPYTHIFQQLETRPYWCRGNSRALDLLKNYFSISFTNRTMVLQIM